MDREKISSVVDKAFSSSFAEWEHQIERDLYPDAFSDQYSWLHVKDALSKNNRFLKEALKSALCDVLSDL